MLKTDVAQLLLDKYGKKNPPAVKAGDTVRVHQRIKEGEKFRVQIFEGLVIAVKHGRGLDGTFTVRKISTGGVGVERTYPLHSPNVVKVERVKTAQVSRAKLYYMRDRKGKTARFKNEDQTALKWEEPAKVDEPVEELIEEAPVAEVEEVVEVPEEIVEAAAEAGDSAAEEVAEATAEAEVAEIAEEAIEDPKE